MKTGQHRHLTASCDRFYSVKSIFSCIFSSICTNSTFAKVLP